jgi:hypothetical protein
LCHAGVGFLCCRVLCICPPYRRHVPHLTTPDDPGQSQHHWALLGITHPGFLCHYLSAPLSSLSTTLVLRPDLPVINPRRGYILSIFHHLLTSSAPALPLPKPTSWLHDPLTLFTEVSLVLIQELAIKSCFLCF